MRKSRRRKSRRRVKKRCKGITQSGKRCRNNATEGSDFCKIHSKKASSDKKPQSFDLNLKIIDCIKIRDDARRFIKVEFNYPGKGRVCQTFYGCSGTNCSKGLTGSSDNTDIARGTFIPFNAFAAQIITQGKIGGEIVNNQINGLPHTSAKEYLLTLSYILKEPWIDNKAEPPFIRFGDAEIVTLVSYLIGGGIWDKPGYEIAREKLSERLGLVETLPPNGSFIPPTDKIINTLFDLNSWVNTCNSWNYLHRLAESDISPISVTPGSKNNPFVIPYSAEYRSVMYGPDKEKVEQIESYKDRMHVLENMLAGEEVDKKTKIRANLELRKNKRLLELSYTDYTTAKYLLTNKKLFQFIVDSSHRDVVPVIIPKEIMQD